MTSSPHLDTFAAANRDLDDMGNALVHGANMAPRLTMDSIIALRSVLTRHQPVELDRLRVFCGSCEAAWPCPDATDVLKALGLPEDDDEGRAY